MEGDTAAGLDAESRKRKKSKGVDDGKEVRKRANAAKTEISDMTSGSEIGSSWDDQLDASDQGGDDDDE